MNIFENKYLQLVVYTQKMRVTLMVDLKKTHFKQFKQVFNIPKSRNQLQSATKKNIHHKQNITPRRLISEAARFLYA